jgi:hypothetical protein
MRGLAAGRRTISWRAEPGADTDWIELSIARAFSPQMVWVCVPGALPQARVARAFSPRFAGMHGPGALPQASVTRAFSPLFAGMHGPGALPQARVGRAVGAGTVALRISGASLEMTAVEGAG